MAIDELNAFLTGAAAPEPAPTAEPAAAPVESTPKPEPTAAQQEAKQPAAPEPEDEEPPAPQEGEAVVPLRALEAVRHERKDWKAKAVAAETRMEDMQRQLEEAKRAASTPPPQPQYQPPPPQPQQIPNPAVDPAGYHQWLMTETAKQELNARLNQSEMLTREKVGDEVVDALIGEFKQAAAADPSLMAKLHAQPHPYAWAVKQMETLKAQREMNGDPQGWLATKLAAERAKWEAEMAAGIPHGGNGAAAPAQRAVPAMAPSLATARSVAGRSAPAFTGPPSLEDIFRRQ